MDFEKLKRIRDRFNISPKEAIQKVERIKWLLGFSNDDDAIEFLLSCPPPKLRK